MLRFTQIRFEFIKQMKTILCFVRINLCFTQTLVVKSRYLMNIAIDFCLWISLSSVDIFVRYNTRRKNHETPVRRVSNNDRDSLSSTTMFQREQRVMFDVPKIRWTVKNYVTIKKFPSAKLTVSYFNWKKSSYQWHHLVSVYKWCHKPNEIK
jgi:hypothetical protein